MDCDLFTLFFAPYLPLPQRLLLFNTYTTHSQTAFAFHHPLSRCPVSSRLQPLYCKGHKTRERARARERERERGREARESEREQQLIPSPPVSSSERAQYSAIIDDILASGDLQTISAKQIRKGLQARLEVDVSDKKVISPRRRAASLLSAITESSAAWDLGLIEGENSKRYRIS